MNEGTEATSGGAMPLPDADAVRAALAEIPYPGLTRDLVSFGMVKHVAACDGRVRVQLALRSGDPSLPDRLRASISEKLVAIGATDVTVEIGPPAPAPTAPVSRTASDPWAEQARLGMVRHVIAVGAGKGGVGKSTVAVNLALALAADGLRTGLLDADIYGPSLPIILGVEERSGDIRMTPEKQIIPIDAHGLPLISFGFFLGEGSPAIWRGPMVSKAVKQFARGVQWPELDVLIVDLPPGTGDIPLSLAQSVQLSGAVVVTQPQRLAGTEAEKAAHMFKTLDVPVLGVVENMTGAFGHGGGARVAEALGVPLLGCVPFDGEVVTEGDGGTPTAVARPGSEVAQAYVQIARNVAAALGWAYQPAATSVYEAAIAATDAAAATAS